MRIFQYRFRGERLVAAAAGRGRPYVVPGVAATLDLIVRAGSSPGRLISFVARQWERYGRKPLPKSALGPIIPLEPPEVWGFGVTYMKSARDREEDAGASGGDIYAHAHRGPRPETFFKATAARCVGPGEAIGIRGDSRLTAAEPELAYVVGSRGNILAYTLGNDVSAWDIERDNPLYLPQSKIYDGCCALGPCLVTADALDPHDVAITMTIRRGGRVVFRGRTRTSLIRFPLPYLHRYLRRSNTVPAGTVALTGTGIMTPAGFGLKPGDDVAISAAGIGMLVNVARKL